MIETTCLGKLRRLRIGHDNSNNDPGWFLEKIIVNDATQKREYEFPCNKWIGGRTYPRSPTSRELEPSVVTDTCPPGERTEN